MGSVRTNLGVGLLVATSARPALAVRGAPRERHKKEYWVADSGSTENMTQDSSNLEDNTPPPQEMRYKTSAGFFSLLQDMGACDSLWTQITAPSMDQRAS